MEIKVSEEVQASSETAEAVVLPGGKTYFVQDFYGAGAFIPNAVIKLVWKYDHDTEAEEIIWSCKGEMKMPFAFEISDADGIRQLAIVLVNGLSGPLTLSGFARIGEAG